MVNRPFSVASVADQFDVNCTVAGGGLSGRAIAIRHGVSRALSLFNPDLRPSLKSAGF